MNFSTFNKIITLMQNHTNNEHEIYKLGISLFDFNDDLEKANSLLLKEIFGVQLPNPQGVGIVNYSHLLLVG